MDSEPAHFLYTFSPTLSLQVFGRPFLAAGSFDAFREVAASRADSFHQRTRTHSGIELTADPEPPLMGIDRDLDGEEDFTLANPSFNIRSIQAIVLLLWESRPGSSLFAVCDTG